MKHQYSKILLCGVFLFFAQVLRAQTVITYAGTLFSSGSTNGPRLQSSFNNPHGIAVDEQGNVYVADRLNHVIRRISAAGVTTTLAGTPGTFGNTNGRGAAALFNEPWDVTVDKQGIVYVADYRNNLIRKITPDGTVSTLAGSGAYGINNGQGTAARFGNPSGIAVDRDGNLIVVDHNTHLIRKVTPSGLVSTIAGKAYTRGSADGTQTEASFSAPYGVTIDNQNNIIIADEHNHKIRKITPSGVVSTIAGSGALGAKDGAATAATFNYPWDVAVDEVDNIYVMDGYNYVVRMITPDGKVSTYVGTPTVKGALDGTGATASFNGATALVYSSFDNSFFVGDAYNHLIRKIERATVEPPPPPVQKPVLSASAADICEGKKLRFTVSAGDYTSYSFYDSTSTTPVLLATTAVSFFETTQLRAGTHHIKVVVKPKTGTEMSSAYVQVVVKPGAVAAFDASQDEGSYEVSFQNKSTGASSFIWNFGDGKSSLETSPVHVYDRAATFSVVLIAQSQTGCNDTIRRTFTVREPEKPEVFIPSGFTPNGDPNNPQLFVRGKGVESIVFRIYNQWGQLVFETQDMDEGWDGTSQGKIHPVGTYVYTLEARVKGGQTIVKKGHINLLR